MWTLVWVRLVRQKNQLIYCALILTYSGLTFACVGPGCISLDQQPVAGMAISHSVEPTHRNLHRLAVEHACPISNDIHKSLKKKAFSHYPRSTCLFLPLRAIDPAAIEWITPPWLRAHCSLFKYRHQQFWYIGYNFNKKSQKTKRPRKTNRESDHFTGVSLHRWAARCPGNSQWYTGDSNKNG